MLTIHILWLLQPTASGPDFADKLVMQLGCHLQGVPSLNLCSCIIGCHTGELQQVLRSTLCSSQRCFQLLSCVPLHRPVPAGAFMLGEAGFTA